MMSFPPTMPIGRPARLFLLVAVLAAFGVTPAVAQIGPSGDPKSLRSGLVRGVDASYDPNTSTYMVVGALGDVFALCTNAAGDRTSEVYTIKPPGTVSGNLPFASFPRVRYSRDLDGGRGAFLVIWQQEEASGPSQLHSRIVSCTAGPLGAEQTIDGGDAPWTDFGASALAYSTTSQRFLVAWKTLYNPVIKARLVDLSGAGVGSAVTLSAGFGRDPGVAWNPNQNEFGVSFSGETASGGFSAFVRVPAADLSAFSRQSFNLTPGGLTTVTDIDFNPVTQSYVMAWWQSLGHAAKIAEFDAGGTMVSTGLASSTLGSVRRPVGSVQPHQRDLRAGRPGDSDRSRSGCRAEQPRVQDERRGPGVQPQPPSGPLHACDIELERE